MLALFTLFFRLDPVRSSIATMTGIVGGIASAALMAILTKCLAAPGDSRLAFAFLALCALSLFFKNLSESLLLDLTQEAIVNYRRDVSLRILGAPFERLNLIGRGKLFSVVTQDIDIFLQVFQLIPRVFGNLVVIAALLAYVAWVSLPAFVFSIVIFTVFLCAYLVLEREPQRGMGQVRSQFDQIHSAFRGLIDGARELKLSPDGGIHYVNRILVPSVERFRSLFQRVMRQYLWLSNGGIMAFYVAIGLILFVAPSQFAVPYHAAVVAALVLLYLSRPTYEWMAAMPLLRQAAQSLTRMEELSLGLVEREAASLDGRLIKNVTLELRGLSYEYDAVRGETGFRLGPLDLTINPNEILFIVGGNGSGKSTLVMLLASLFVPSDGSLNLAGIEISPATTAWYRAHISVIFSDFHLFDHVFSNSNTDLQLRAEYLLQRLSLHEKVRLQDGQFSTTALSTGQRKRLALVATLLQDKPILVLDEWAADQDPSHRRFFYTELLPELKRAGKTIIVITHDEMYFDCADRIVSIVEGRMLQLNKRDANIGVSEEGKGF